MRLTYSLVLILAADLLLANPAWAADCPAPYNGGWDLCGAPVGMLWTCDLTAGGSSNAGTA